METQEHLTFTEQEARNIPTIIYDEKLNEPDVPYSVSIDPQKFASLLKNVGMPEEKIAELKVRVKRKLPLGIAGHFFPPSNIIRVSVDDVWGVYQKHLDKADKIISGQLRPKKDTFSELLVTKRLPEYLTKAPPERGKRFAQWLLQRTAERKLSEKMAHETKHALDKHNLALTITDYLKSGLSLPVGYNLYKVVIAVAEKAASLPEGHFRASDPQTYFAQAMMMALGVGLVVFNFHPKELRAEKFQKVVYKNPNWYSFIKLVPKEDKSRR